MKTLLVFVLVAVAVSSAFRISGRRSHRRNGRWKKEQFMAMTASERVDWVCSRHGDDIFNDDTDDDDETALTHRHGHHRHHGHRQLIQDIVEQCCDLEEDTARGACYTDIKAVMFEEFCDSEDSHHESIRETCCQLTGEALGECIHEQKHLAKKQHYGARHGWHAMSAEERIEKICSITGDDDTEDEADADDVTVERTRRGAGRAQRRHPRRQDVTQEIANECCSLEEDDRLECYNEIREEKYDAFCESEDTRTAEVREKCCQIQDVDELSRCIHDNKPHRRGGRGRGGHHGGRGRGRHGRPGAKDQDVDDE